MRAGRAAAAAALSIALCAVAALALWNRWIVVPDDWNPWRPLDLAAPPGFLTRYKLARLTGDRTLCFEILKTAPMEFEALPDRQTGPSCGLYGAVTITRTTAEAFDLAGVVLNDERRIRVLGDWKEDSAEGLFLHAIRDGACRFFDGVLSPDYNAAHRDHLHLDRGPYRVCR